MKQISYVAQFFGNRQWRISGEVALGLQGLGIHSNQASATYSRSLSQNINRTKKNLSLLSDPIDRKFLR